MIGGPGRAASGRASGSAAPGHVVLRADASAEIGSGHVIRCRTLGEELRRRGWTATLVSRQLDERLGRSFDAAGIDRVELPASLPIELEPGHLARALQKHVDLLVADHYAIDAGWLTAAREWAPILLSIDDLADRPQPVDLLLNQNLGVAADQYAGLVPTSTRVLTGPRYALVRPAFAEAHRHRRVRSGRLEHALVLMGGADAADVTRRSAAGVVAAGIPVDVVVGPLYPHRAALRSWAAGQPLVRLQVDPPDVAGLMDRADLAIGAPGSASWERCAVGLPTVLVILARNQVEPGRSLVEAGAAQSLGWHTDVTSVDVTRIVRALAADPSAVRAMSGQAAAVTDGRGTERVVSEIEAIVSATRGAGRS